MPIFRVKSVKIYTSQKKFTRELSWLSWQIWGMNINVLSNAKYWCLSRCKYSQIQIIIILQSFTATNFQTRCTLLVEETIPRGAFVDPDEMRDLRSANTHWPNFFLSMSCSMLTEMSRHRTGLRTYIPSKVDIEKPEFESEAFRYVVDMVIRTN